MARAHPPRSHGARSDPADTKVFLIGGGIASLAAAVFLIRDGGIPGCNITIRDELDTIGGSLDARPAFRGREAADAKDAGWADNALRRAVLALLIAHPLIDAGHIRAAAAGGKVTLSGYVTSNAKKDAAITAARRVEGVDQVVDNLTVAVPSPAVADAPASALEAWPDPVAARPFSAFATMPVA
jgi:hypothetical protein